jgi:exodeoxyribonuclease VII small subunit
MESGEVMSDKLTFQDNLDYLEEIVDKLESGETTLEESLELYKKGIIALEKCNEKIDMVEKEIEIIHNER